MDSQPLWTIDESREIKKSRKRYKSDKPVCNAFQNYIKALSNEVDPAAIAYEKNKDGIYILRLTKSVRLSYWIDDKTKTIYLCKLGDHKEVYGYD